MICPVELAHEVSALSGFDPRRLLQISSVRLGSPMAARLQRTAVSQSPPPPILSPDLVIPCTLFTWREAMDIQNQTWFTIKIYEQLRPTRRWGFPAPGLKQLWSGLRFKILNIMIPLDNRYQRKPDLRTALICFLFLRCKQ